MFATLLRQEERGEQTLDRMYQTISSLEVFATEQDAPHGARPALGGRRGLQRGHGLNQGLHEHLDDTVRRNQHRGRLRYQASCHRQTV
ncbi:hypothetical protein D5R93_07035 [Actinomyces lilanjuaniae]|uniref:Resolvase/invertase-type recombinase catalytic domain-containing protein n=1 Tax=Actinomyces lilanjuaniae TaxID=2321394 RepID=A0ABM6Z4I6_9ACTO|nr:hypothetical protein D5R93_07035 [Actinomyces lilanjuaniae]